MSKIGKMEWLVLYVVMGIIDFAQFALDFTGFGAGLNTFADPFIGIVLAGYFQIRGVSLVKHPSRLFSLIGVTLLDGITGGMAPAWVFDIWYIKRTVDNEQAEFEAAQKSQEFRGMNVRNPIYQGGVRQPRVIDAGATERSNIMPANFDGVRAPGGGLTTNRNNREDRLAA